MSDRPFSTHKVRADWFQQRTSYPQREAVPRDLARTRAATGPLWKEAGPPDIGGRLTSLAVDPANPDQVFVGAAGGGVWVTQNAGRDWRQLWSDRAETLAIGSLLLDPHDSNVLYAGTGEANLSGETYPGAGLYKVSSGADWQRIGSCDKVLADKVVNGQTIHVFAVGVPRRIGSIAVNPFVAGSQHILIGGVTHSEDEGAALFETVDAGKNWHQALDQNANFERSLREGFFIGPLDYFCHSVMFHPDVEGFVVAAVEARGTQSGIWISRDHAKSWVQATKGLPSGDQFGRTALTLASGSKTIYALAGQQGTQKLLGVYRSDDLGATWTECGRGGFERDGQLSYTNCIAMDPANPMTAVLGSLELYKTTDGGKTWTQISDGKNPFGHKYVHRDHHALWIGKGRIYCANDGGFAVSEDGGETWEMRNKSLAIAMLYDVAVAPGNASCMGCGLQDNGTWFVGALDPPADDVQPPTAFRQELEGDGGWTCYDPDDETHVFASQQRMDLWRHRTSDSWTNLDLSMIPDAERKSVWMAVLTMDKSNPGAPRTAPRAVYIGSNRLWRSLDDGDSWEAISDAFDGSVISAIEVATADPQRIYIGTTNGGVFRSTDGGATWSRNLAGPFSPGRIVTRIATDFFDPRQVYFTVGVISNEWSVDAPVWQASTRMLRQNLPLHREDGSEAFVDFHHLFWSQDGGDTFNDPDLGFLPNLPHNSVAVSSTGEVYLGHDGGVAVRNGQAIQFDDPRPWLEITGNLPNIRITDLVWHEIGHMVVVSTYGRGIWTLSVDDLKSWLAQRKPSG